MLRNTTLRLSAFLLVACFASSASACCLFPFLNPFAWTCGYGCGTGCGTGCGYGGCGLGLLNPWSYPGYGQSGYPGGYRSYTGSVYTPSYSPGYGAPAADCNCGATHGPANVPMAAPATGAAWNTPSTAWNANATAWNRPANRWAGWGPQRRRWPAAGNWQHAPHGMSAGNFQAPQTAMSTAPIYGPVWEVPQTHAQSRRPAAPGAHVHGPEHRQYPPRVAGDAYGDHEQHVMQNSFQPAAGIPVRPASYRQYRRPARRYGQVVR